MTLKRPEKLRSDSLRLRGSSGWVAVLTTFSPLQQVGFMVLSVRGGSAADDHVGQPEQDVKLMPILCQSAIPHFPMAE